MSENCELIRLFLREKWVFILCILMLFVIAYFIPSNYGQNVLISVGASFLVYFMTVTYVSFKTTHKLKDVLKQKHKNFKYNMITLFLNCAKLRCDPKTIEELLEPQRFKTFFMQTKNNMCHIDRVMNGLMEDELKYSDLKVDVTLFFETTISLAMGAGVDLEILRKILAWKDRFVDLQKNSILNQDVRYIIEDLFCWFSNWSKLDESPYSFEHVIDEI